MAVDFRAGAYTALHKYIKAGGNENIVLHEILSVDGGPTRYAVRCNVCNYSADWTYNIHEQYGIELDLINGFCKAHEHLPKLSQPITNETVLTKSMVQNYSDMLIHPKMKEDIEADGDPFNLLGDIKVHVAKPRQIVAISSTGIKFVARKSNFNVDVQNKNGLYRGYCNICGKDMSLTREEILDLDKEKASLDFDEFLKIHLHDGSDRELPKGRKFRHASKQG